MENRFFSKALNNANVVAGRKGRLLLLLTQLSAKLKDVDWKNVNVHHLRGKLSTFGRLGKAYANGQYRHVPWKTMLAVTSSILYFVNPLDLVPDVLPLTGFTDDFTILVWVYNSVTTEIDKFLAWERSLNEPL